MCDVDNSLKKVCLRNCLSESARVWLGRTQDSGTGESSTFLCSCWSLFLFSLHMKYLYTGESHHHPSLESHNLSSHIISFMSITHLRHLYSHPRVAFLEEHTRELQAGLKGVRDRCALLSLPLNFMGTRDLFGKTSYPFFSILSLIKLVFPL